MESLLTMLRKKAHSVALWQALFVLAVIWGFASSHIAERTAMGRMRIAVPDIKGGFLYIDNAGSFDTADKIHAEIAKMAVETIFNRNPNVDNNLSSTDRPDPYGFDNPERLERLFNPITAAQLKAEASRDRDAFRAEGIHQKIETGRIKELGVDNNTALISVDGQVRREGVFNQRPFNIAKNVTVFLKLAINDSMASNGRYPMVVVQYNETWTRNESQN